MSLPDKETLRRRLAEALTQLRKDRGLTESELAQRMGKKPHAGTQISRWERCEATPGADQLWLYLIALDASFADPDRPKLERAFGRPVIKPPEVALEARAENLVRHLAAQRATWSEEDLRRLSDRDLDGDALLRRALASDQIVTVGTGPRIPQQHSVVGRLPAE